MSIYVFWIYVYPNYMLLGVGDANKMAHVSGWEIIVKVNSYLLKTKNQSEYLL